MDDAMFSYNDANGQDQARTLRLEEFVRWRYFAPNTQYFNKARSVYLLFNKSTRPQQIEPVEFEPYRQQEKTRGGWCR